MVGMVMNTTVAQKKILFNKFNIKYNPIINNINNIVNIYMLNQILAMLIFFMLIKYLNTKVFEYFGYPYYIDIHNYLKDSRVFLYDKMNRPFYTSCSF